jgi:phosphatidylcholine synthase
MAPPSHTVATPLHRKLAAWAVHAFTASGAVAGLLALLAIGDEQWLNAFAWMGVSVLIDGVDGSLARKARVKDVLPNVDGALLDNLVDYFTYVVVPAVFICEAAMLPPRTALLGASAMILSSAYQFCQTDAKTEDHYFKGWPSYWNILVFYLFIFDLGPRWNLAFVLACAVLVFIPIRYLYPSRAERFRSLHMLLAAVWAITLAVLWYQYPERSAGVLALSILYMIYYHGVSLYVTFRNQ